MKSQQQEQTIKTSCKSCAFAIFNDSKQTGCVFNRLLKFGNNVVKNEEHFIINRLCTYYRDTAWGYTQNDTIKVEAESAIPFDIIFDCNELDTYKENKIIDFINNHNYIDKKFKIYLSHENINFADVKDAIARIASKSNKQLNISVCFDRERYLHELILNSKNGYHCVINNIEKLSCNILHDVNNAINKDLKRFILAEQNNNFIVNNYIYRSIYYLCPMKKYNEIIESIYEQSKTTNMYLELPNEN